ncbi:Rrf2 family transcriptional regulator [Oxalobacter vibrioformis]|uniref:Rrf2 family transcriptional regulator n=1 Tax=Oxalobacter vibrioformis TaxID=933080 RepID=A0A9E9LWP0_9BURK|nr:Rrf2 family transcriptional regulator [Oxalobacter vibrioformis]NLC23774.1 Rrf2 family transcriptional regulator [Oxalobacter sp.]WAW10067.1 Rrf2 family transcriptional regulator [Oxalobacter vibrioformis]
MKFSTRTRYALRLMLDLVSVPAGEFVALKDIAKKQDISVKYLEQIVIFLTRAGLLVSSRGPQGGYRLAKKPSEYTPGDVIRAIEGNLAPIACLEQQPNTCPRAAHCTTLRFWEGLHQATSAYFDSMTLEDLGSSENPADLCMR